ncbi:TRAP transporter small permease subunit [Deltaproteobacteria bacterium TL4]
MVKPFLLWMTSSLDQFNDWVGRTCAWLTLSMGIVTCATAILRYAFNLGWVWMQESSTYMHAALFMLTGGYALLHGSHVRIDIWYTNRSLKTKAVVDLLGALFFLLPMCCVIFYYSLPYVLSSWSVLEKSPSDGLPFVYLLKTLLLMAPLLLGLQGLSGMGRSLLWLLGQEEAPDFKTEEKYAL